MDLGLISVTAAVLQLGVALSALMLMRLTGFRLAWLLISIAFFIMAIRRSLYIPRVCSWAFGALQPPQVLDHLVVLTITVMMFAGVLLIAPLFKDIKRAAETLRQAKTQLEINVAKRTEELRDANARLAVELDERRRAEYLLTQYAEELKRSNTELEQFAYVASHDLQEPLRMVASFTQLLAKRYQGKLDREADEFIGFAVDGATRMQSLINDLLAYSRVGSRGKPFQPVNCAAVVSQALANLASTVEEAHAVVTQDRLPTVPGDAGQLVQLFQNLIANAIKFRGPDLPEIHVTANQTDGGWTFAIRDNGIGIPAEHFDRIFSIFQRLHRRSDYAGTGIGLAICKKIVERHGGRIWVESNPGRGSTFYFTLPEEEDTAHDGKTEL
jgi:light-regulated signal transduction histidine kinase (bacteriophytochrome)